MQEAQQVPLVQIYDANTGEKSDMSPDDAPIVKIPPSRNPKKNGFKAAFSFMLNTGTATYQYAIPPHLVPPPEGEIRFNILAPKPCELRKIHIRSTVTVGKNQKIYSNHKDLNRILTKGQFVEGSVKMRNDPARLGSP